MKLSIPENIPLRWELYRGFGKPEVVKSVIISGVVLLLSLLYARLTHSSSTPLIAVVAVVLSLSFCAGLFGKMDGQSIYDWMTRQLAYRRNQQTFPHKSQKEVISFVQEET